VVYDSCAAELLRIIRSDYLNELVDVEVNGRQLQPAKCLPWCVSFLEFSQAALTGM